MHNTWIQLCWELCIHLITFVFFLIHHTLNLVLFLFSKSLAYISDHWINMFMFATFCLMFHNIFLLYFQAGFCRHLQFVILLHTFLCSDILWNVSYNLAYLCVFEYPWNIKKLYRCASILQTIGRNMQIQFHIMPLSDVVIQTIHNPCFKFNYIPHMGDHSTSQKCANNK